MKLNFLENIDLDVANWQQSVLTTSQGMDWVSFLPTDIKIEDIENTEYLRRYLKKKYYESGQVSDYRKWLESTVDYLQIQGDLEGLMGNKFTHDEVDVRITTFNRAPYNIGQGFFYTILRNVNRERVITIIYHELMHFLFHIYYWEECKEAGLSESQTDDLKECLTVLLNPILKKRGLPSDPGYSKHQELRSALARLWESKKWEFKDFLRDILKSGLFSEGCSEK